MLRWSEGDKLYSHDSSRRRKSSHAARVGSEDPGGADIACARAQRHYFWCLTKCPRQPIAPPPKKKETTMLIDC